MGVGTGVYSPKDFELNRIMSDIVTLADPGSSLRNRTARPRGREFRATSVPAIGTVPPNALAFDEIILMS